MARPSDSSCVDSKAWSRSSQPTKAFRRTAVAVAVPPTHRLFVFVLVVVVVVVLVLVHDYEDE
jgi:hypothetical protein